MKLGFMTSLAQDKSLSDLIALAEAHGYQGIEFRPEWQQAHGVELSMTKAQRQEARTLFANHGIDISAVSPGVRFCRDDRDQQLETMYRYIDLAADLGAGCIRFFADPLPEDRQQRQESRKIQADYQALAAERAWQAGVVLALETHGNCIGVDVGEMMRLADYPPAFRVNWHLSHCLRHGEDTDTAYGHVKGRVVHAHFGFAREQEAQQPLERQFELLLYDGFQGYFSLEVIQKGDNTDLLIDTAKQWQRMKDKFHV
jgi:sugar phosphate isomerase/epimerase